MRLMVALVILGILGSLQFACGQAVDSYRSYNTMRIYHNDTTRFIHSNYGNATNIWGRREDAKELMEELQVTYTKKEISECMSRKSSVTQITYGFVGKFTADASLPLNRNEYRCPITYIEVRTLTRNVGFVCVTKGGLGHRTAHIHLESKINCDLDYVIKIYGLCYEPPTQPTCSIPPIPPCDETHCDDCVSPCKSGC